jgi:putative nucleotidyltransferase with HDIG domain
MSHTTVLRPTADSTVGGAPSHSVFARSWAIPGAGPLPTVGERSPVRAVTLPPLSDTVARAAALAGDPDASLTDFADLVRGDPALTALLLKRANSAAVGAATADVRQAVTLLGLRTCSQLVASVGVRNLLRDAPAELAGRCEAVLRHSLMVAHLASQLNRSAGLGFRGEEFVGGLLHDIGRVLLTLSRPHEAAAADPLDHDEPPERLARERTMLGTDHCAVGAEFAAASKLPPPVVRAVLKHHAPFDDAGQHRPLVALVAVADHLANHVQRTRRVADYDPWTGFGYGVLSEHWSADRHDRFAAVVAVAVVTALRGTRATLRFVPD